METTTETAETPKPKTMRVWVPLDVTEYDRFAIMKYFQPVDKTKRRRATRKQVKAFAVAALKTAVDERVSMLRGRSRGAANRLKEGAPTKVEEKLTPADESQRTLF